jgi:hypothetical protein
MSGDNGMPPLDLSMFRDDVTEFGKDLDSIGVEFIRDVIKPALAEQKRSLQKEIGPSELGVPCQRWLAHKFAGTPPTGIPKAKWAAAIGTAAHDHLSQWCHAYNERHGVSRYLFDLLVYVGDLYPGRPITGHLDVYDVWRAVVLDAKFPGATQMDKYRPVSAAENPQYSDQVHCYGNGIVNAGLPVAAVGMLRLPRGSDNLDDGYWRWEPHDPARGRRALQRAGAIAAMVDAVGPDIIPTFPTTEHHCANCPFYLPGAKDLTKACPGADSVITRRDRVPSHIAALMA